MTNDDLLFNITIVTNRVVEDAIGLGVPREDVWLESRLHHCLRDDFNARLRGLRDAGLVTLTRTTVALTQDGFDRAWA